MADPARRRLQLGLRGQLLLTLATIIVTLLLSLGLLAWYQLSRAYRQEARERTDSVADRVAGLISNRAHARRPLAGAENRRRLMPALRRLAKLHGVVEILAVAANGETLRLGRSGFPDDPGSDGDLASALRGATVSARIRALPKGGGGLEGPPLVAYRPCKLGGQRRAAVRVVLSPERLVAQRLSGFWTGVVILAIIDGLLLLIFGAVFLSKRVLAPIRRMAAAAEAVAGGERDVQVAVGGAGEIRQLGERFNHMVDTLRARDLELALKLEELERKQQELDQSWEVLLRSAKLASVGRLAAGVAHELGNPLASIIGYLTLIDDDETPEEDRARFLAQMRAELGRMDKTIRSLLDTARPGEDAVGPTDLAQVIRQAAELAGHQKRLANVDIDLELPDDLPRATASTRLSQVFVNLLLNAGDAMEARGQVTVRARRLGARIQVTIADSGPGVPVEARADLFDPFFTTKAPGEGTGLGLAISQSILEASGGQIALSDPQPETGASFELTFKVWKD